MRNNSGITLVALVITIIIMLTVVGVSISLITGESGLFGRAVIARNQYNTASSEENDRLSGLNTYYTTYDTNTSGSGKSAIVPNLVENENVTFKFTPEAPTWAKKVKLEIIETTNSGHTLQYKMFKVNEETDWTDYTGPIEIDENGTVVVAQMINKDTRVTGTGVATSEVTNVDNLPPDDFSITTLYKNETTIVITGSGLKDANPTQTSGSSFISKYQYKIDDGDWTDELNDSGYTFVGLESGTEYTIYMKAIDAAGNDKTVSTKISTN